MKFVPNAVSTTVARAALQTQKASPQALFVGGLVGFGVTVVLACRATLKVEDVLDEHERKAELIKDALLAQLDDYDSKDAQQDKVKLLLKTGVELGKIYWPALLAGGISIAFLTGSHNILNKRNAALAAAYGTIEKAFSDYRGRVREAYGEGKELEIYHGVETCEIEDPETGKKTKRKIATGASPYTRFFDRDTSKDWSRIPEDNWFFLRIQQEYANNRLQARGHLFLNEVYDSLGLEHTMEGAVVGWVKDQGDNYVDFGIFNDRTQETVRDFMIGQETGIWLDFNVDGVIYNKI